MNNQQILTGVEALSILQIMDLTEALYKRWGITPPSYIQPISQVVEKPAEEAQTQFSLKLVSFEVPAKIVVIKLIREITGLGIAEAKKMSESVPIVIKDGLSKADAETVNAKFQGVRCVTELV